MSEDNATGVGIKYVRAPVAVATSDAERDAYPALPHPQGEIDQGGGWKQPTQFFTVEQMHAYVDADRKERQLAACNFCLAEAAKARAALPIDFKQATDQGGWQLYVECRECSNCGRVGINDDAKGMAACNSCDWNGPSPKEDHCPQCERDGTMTGSCPECGHRTTLIADARIAPPCASQTERAAARDVLAERQRQISTEGWTPAHDDQYKHGDLASAAACYATQGRYHYPTAGKPGPIWPWPPEWWKPTTYRRNLVKAAALLLAEIERLDRAAAPTLLGVADGDAAGGKSGGEQQEATSALPASAQREATRSPADRTLPTQKE